MTRTADIAHLSLPDGSDLEFEIRSSEKARSLRLKINARHGLVVTAPQGLERGRVMQLVSSKVDWIAGRLAGFQAIRHLVSNELPVRPQAFNLPALAESWRVEYKETRSRTVGARIDQPGRIVVLGAVDDVERCQAALRRWLARHAKDVLPSWLSNLSQQSKLRYTDLAIKNQRTRWGSCTSRGRITLNCKLLISASRSGGLRDGARAVSTSWRPITRSGSGFTCVSSNPPLMSCTAECAMPGSWYHLGLSVGLACSYDGVSLSLY